MPAGNVRPKVSQAPRLTDTDKSGAISQYERRGFRKGTEGNIGTGTDQGPCVRCQQRHTRYGVNGRALCPACRGEVPVAQPDVGEG